MSKQTIEARQRQHIPALVPLKTYKAVFTVSNGETFERSVAAMDEIEAAKAVRKYFAFETLKSITHTGTVHVSSDGYSTLV